MASECPDFHHPERRLSDNCPCSRPSGHVDQGFRHACEHGFLWSDDRLDSMELDAAIQRQRTRDRAHLEALADKHVADSNVSPSPYGDGNTLPSARDGVRSALESFIEIILDAGFTTGRHSK